MEKNLGRWLKKYMTLEYLEKTLIRQELFLGDPQSWPDKNDSKVLDVYKSQMALKAVRATCMSMAPDRYHFWKLFGDSENGVCLWFDRKSLERDMEGDTSLRWKKVSYYTPSKLKEKCKLSELPFAKRAQYADEKEYRVLREYAETDKKLGYGITFQPASLKRIYLNSWLSRNTYKHLKRKIAYTSPSIYSHLKIKQNRVLDYKVWIDAAAEVK